jgi:hypothetical protein
MNKKISKLEKAFNIASDKVDSFDVDESTNDIILSNGEYSVDDYSGPVSLAEDGQMFELLELKEDFLSVKCNIQALIRKGQRLLDQALESPDASISPRQIEAITGLSTAIGTQCKTLAELYTEIEKIGANRKGKSINQTQGTVNNNTAIFVGDTSQLLNTIKEHHVKDV